MRPTVDMIIPTYKPGASCRELLHMLMQQYYHISHILIVNTEEKYWRDDLIGNVPCAEVFHIPKKEFDHGAARNMGAGFSNADYLIFMTQDAVPADRRLVGTLVRCFSDPDIKAAYARQLPRDDCRIVEGCVRTFNYPEESAVRSSDDLEEMGIRTYFCSNVCAAYEREYFMHLGGFPVPSIFNEDMIFASSVINEGYCVEYCAKALVYHSHDYTLRQQFRRNFDNGVSQAMHPEVFGAIRSEGEGMKLVRYVCGALRSIGRLYLVPSFLVQCAFRWAGFRFGKIYRFLPLPVVRHFSMNRDFWNYRGTDDLGEV